MKGLLYGGNGDCLDGGLLPHELIDVLMKIPTQGEIDEESVGSDLTDEDVEKILKETLSEERFNELKRLCG